MPDPEANEKWQFLNQTGFPIVVAGWFMLRLEKRLDKIFRILLRIAHKVGASDQDNRGEDE